MRKTRVTLLLAVLCLLILPFSVSADESEPIRITLQPQNPTFPENGYASWSVEAEGDDLTYEWFIVYQGMTYETSKAYTESQPWLEGISEAGYGQSEEGDVFFIYEIRRLLEGAELFCRISREGAPGVVYSSKAIISVGSKVAPPILRVPSAVLIEQGQLLKLTCNATAIPGDSIESYLWCETKTGSLRDIIAVGAFEDYAEVNPVMVCDTSEVGTRYYVCSVCTKEGGTTYSSVIPVTVYAKGTAPTVPPTAPPTEAPSTETPTGSSVQEPTGAPSSAPATEAPSPSVQPSESPARPLPGKSEETSGGLSVTAAALIALGGLLLGGCLILAALIISKKKK